MTRQVFIAFATRNIMWDLMADWYFLLAHILALNTGSVGRPVSQSIRHSASQSA